jgi:hypothetical protein
MRTVDKNGNTLTETYLDLDDNPVDNSAGYATERNTWDDRKRVIRRDYLDVTGQPMSVNEGYSGIGYEYDDRDNLIRESYYNTSGDLTWCRYGYSEILYSYDVRNHCVEERLLNSNGKPAIHNTCYYSSLKRDVDPDGKTLSVMYFDTDGTCTSYKNQYAEVQYEYDLAGRETSISYYDRAGNPCMCLQGYHQMTQAYNTLGNVTEIAYYDTENNLVDTKMKYAKVVNTYDDLGNLTLTQYFNTKQLGVIPADERYAMVQMDYDDFGRLTAERYYDESDMPVKNREGFASHEMSYTREGRIAEEHYLDEKDNPVKIAEGYTSRILISEDRTGETYVMEVLNEAATEDDLYSKIIQTYDRYDRPIESVYQDMNGNPAIGPEGSAIVEREYTSRGEISKVLYYDENRNSTAVNGVFGIQFEYNAYGNLERETWIGKDGKPTANEDGYASIWYDYDLSNVTTVEKYFQYYMDTEGNAIAASNGAWGMITQYAPLTRIHEMIFVGQDHQPVMTTDQYAIYQYETDDNGNVVWEEYQDEIRAKTNCADGFCSVTREYDSEGRLISERYTDRYNQLANNTEGVASWNGYYDEEGNLVITNRYDKDLKPVEIP